MKKHLGYYLSFLVILGAGIFLILEAQGNTHMQLLYVALFAACYFIWGVLHHMVHHSISLRIVIEYFVVALLGVAVIFFVLNGGL